MKVQCPKCHTTCQTRSLAQSDSPLQVNCPRCQYRFLLLQDADVMTVEHLPARILIVDDARFFRELLLDLFEKRNAVLTTADSAETALRLLTKQDFDLLIIDINLPDTDGLELIRQIRAVEHLQHVKILCVSGVYRHSGDARNALIAGADDFISKSFDAEELDRRIDTLLEL